MHKLLRYASFYLAVPFLVSAAANILIFKAAPERFLGSGVLLAAVAACLVCDRFFGPALPQLSTFHNLDFAGGREAFVFLQLAFVIVLFCGIDLALYPIPLLTDPTIYATFTDGRNYVRHVSSLCWILPVVALLCTKRKSLQGTLIAIGFLFPILVIDRNRLFASLFSVALLSIFRSARIPKLRIALVLLAGAIVFSVLGSIRTGTLDHLTLPYTDLFYAMPEALKWLLLYAGAGTYNFTSMLAKDYQNPDFLAFQLSPGGLAAPDQSVIPFDAPTINVGTELLPFLLAFGIQGAVFAMIALYLMLLLGAKLVSWAPSLGSLLIFLRLSYVAVMSPFAPQAFTFTNFGAIALFGVCWCVATMLPPTSTDEPAKDSAHV